MVSFSWIETEYKLVLAAAHFSDAAVALSPFHQGEQIRQSSVAKLPKPAAGSQGGEKKGQKTKQNKPKNPCSEAQLDSEADGGSKADGGSEPEIVGSLQQQRLF